jgi:hypothetical protein
MFPLSIGHRDGRTCRTVGSGLGVALSANEEFADGWSSWLADLPNVRLLVLFEGCVGLLFYAPVMIIYFDSVTGSYALAMSVISTTMLTAALLEVPTGVLADLVGRGFTIRLGAVANVLLVGANLIDRVSSALAFSLPGAASPALLSANSLTYGASQVATNVLAQREFTSAQRATLGSISALAGGIVFAVASTGLGALADRFGTPSALLLAQIGLAVPLLLYWRVFANQRKMRA